ncbi:hypothetical protein [Terriglobus albidus]|uniref:hypothetical protein n=1 Tax=Terriglobus albidus TaxID=1592106 RepID=UPI0021DFF96F|nr:hypothetical protein [Terriglobus albidus]
MNPFQRHSVTPAILLAGFLAINTTHLAAQAPAAAPTGPIPASTLTTPSTPTAVPNPAGFIQRWMVLEPIPVNGLTQNAVQAEVRKYALPEGLTVVPKNGDKTNVGGADLTWHALDTKNYNLNLFHFARSLAKPTSDVLFWVTTVVNSPVEMNNVRLAIGSNAASIWWLNGEEVIGIYGDRQTVIDDGVSKRLTLKKGENIIRAAVVNGGGATDFCARLLDADDKPVEGYTINLRK